MGKEGFDKFFEAIQDSEFKSILDFYIKRLRVFMKELEKKE